jgi:subtilisin family serine protease
MSKLDLSLQRAVASWRKQVGNARSGRFPELNLVEVEGRKVMVIVTFSGDIAALRTAGLQSGYDSGGLVTGLIAFTELERLEAVPGVISVGKQPTLKTLLDDTVSEMRVPWKVPPTTPWPGKGAGVIVAVIDTGIDIFHESFRKTDGTTRILELWDQGATTGGAAPPAAFIQLGRVYTAANINASLTAGPPFASIDNDGHGTSVAGIAAGSGRQDDRCSFPGRYVGVAPEADLVIVKAVGVPNGSTSDALNWCAQAGTRLPGNKPVVINCSFAFETGPHDGTGPIDVLIDPILRPAAGPPAGLAIVAGAGNFARDELHESGTVPANGTATVSFYIRDGSTAMDTLAIWYNGTATLNIELIAPPNPSVPGPNTTGPIAPGAPGPFTIGFMTLDVLSATAPIVNHNNLKQINVGISPITPPADRVVRPGIWQMRLTETGGAAANWEAWFATSHTESFPTFRLPSEPDRVERRRENTIGEPGTSRNTITVAAYEDGSGALANYSSRGPSTPPVGSPVGELKPTIAAPGVGVAAPRSRNHPKSNSSCCDQLVIDADGTSMATPHVSGLVALMLQKNKTLTFEQIRGHLQHSARIDGIPAAEVPPVFDAVLGIRANALWGSGKVNAAAALAEMPAAPGGGGGGGGGGGIVPFDESELGFTPHNLISRLGDWRNRHGPRPGLMLFASLVSEHVDEVLRLVNHNRRVGAVWRRCGGPLLVRRLLHGPPPQDVLLPPAIEGCDVALLVTRLLPVLARFGGPRLRADVTRFRGFAALWPGGDLARLDEAALQWGGTS